MLPQCTDVAHRRFGRQHPGPRAAGRYGARRAGETPTRGTAGPTTWCPPGLRHARIDHLSRTGDHAREPAPTDLAAGPGGVQCRRSSAAAAASTAAATTAGPGRRVASTGDRDRGQQLHRVGVPLRAGGWLGRLAHRTVDLEGVAARAATEVVSRHAPRVRIRPDPPAGPGRREPLPWPGAGLLFPARPEPAWCSRPVPVRPGIPGRSRAGVVFPAGPAPASSPVRGGSGDLSGTAAVPPATCGQQVLSCRWRTVRTHPRSDGGRCLLLRTRAARWAAPAPPRRRRTPLPRPAGKAEPPRPTRRPPQETARPATRPLRPRSRPATRPLWLKAEPPRPTRR